MASVTPSGLDWSESEVVNCLDAMILELTASAEWPILEPDFEVWE